MRTSATSLGFQSDFPEARSIVLGENYRSTGNIVGAAQKVISANIQRIPKELWTSKEQGPPVVVHETHDEEEEAQYVISEVERLGRVEGTSLGDCAVMYRVNAQSRALEEGMPPLWPPLRAGGRCALLPA